MSVEYRDSKQPAIPKTIQVFNTSGNHTWKKPEGCVAVKVQVIGAGGGAAGYWESGGAGGYSEDYIDVTEIDEVSVTVGAGGGYVGYFGVAGDGTSSFFGSYLYASGGYGANRQHSHSGGLGGLGYGGLINLQGGGATGHVNGGSSGAGARGGSSYFGGPAGDNRGSNHAKNGNGAPGSGGPGSRTDTGWGGQVGETGIVVVHEYY